MEEAVARWDKVVTPKGAWARQVERYRRMSGEQRLSIAFELNELSNEIVRAGIRRQYPEADEAEVAHRLKERILAPR